MKILYLSYYFKPDITAAAFRSTDFVDFLSQKKIDNRVITTFPHKSEITEEINNNENTQYRIHLKTLSSNKFTSYLSHYLSYIPKSIFIAIKWRIKGWKPSVIFISSPPIFIGISGIILKWLFRVKLVTEIRDIWPDSAVAAKQISESGKAYKYARKFEKFLYKQSDGLVCVGKYMKEYLKDYTLKPICVAYNGPNIDDNELNKAKNLKNELIDNTIKIVYAGNIGSVQGLDLLIKAFNKFSKLEKNYKWELIFYGTGVMEAELKELTDKYNLNKIVSFLGVFPKKELEKHLLNSSILFLSLVKSPTLEKTIPSKLFDYLFFGKPIIAAISGEGKEILKNNSSNIVVDCDNENAILEGLVKIDNSYKELDKTSKINIDILKKGFIRKTNNEKILEFINKIYLF